MGVTVREMLENKYFSEYKLLAGRKGIERTIHAATVFDSPDGYRWFRGKELVLSTGYLFVNNTELLREVIVYLNSRNVAGMAIKTSRYLSRIPDEIIELADDLNFPIIEVPYREAWIDIISQINSIAINRFLTSVIEKHLLKDIPLKPYSLKKKVDDILVSMYHEINVPVSVLNLVDKTIFTYPLGFQPDERILSYNPAEEYGFSHRVDVISDKPNVFRYTDLESPDNGSWLVMTITIKGLTISKVIVWEGHTEMDYYNLFSLKIAIALLYELYEHIYSMNFIEGRYYDEFLYSLINGEIENKQKLIGYTENFLNFNLNLDSSFLCVCIKQKEGKPSLFNERERMFNTVFYKLPGYQSILGVIDDNTLAILYDTEKFTKPVDDIKREVSVILEELDYILPKRGFKAGIGEPAVTVMHSKRSFMESKKAIEIGSYLYPERNIVTFSELGPFGVLRYEDVEKKNFGSSFNVLEPLLKEEDGKELIETLKVYLENGSNCNKAAAKLYIHSNTVRYRVAKIQEICNIDLDDYIERLKLEITLRFIE